MATSIGIALILALPLSASAEESLTPADLTGLSIEQLLNVEVYSASKFVQKITEAPASVSIVTAADIKGYGYRTLADILRGVRGLFVTYDRNYNYVGVRGFDRPGDYNSRILLLVDGYRVNDTLYDTATIGTEFFLDADLIDRVEVVRGPGSSIYGSNAFFGVINVITKRGRDFNGAEISGEAASSGSGKARMTYGRQQENGAEVLVSASYSDSKGQDLFFPEFNTPANNNGIAQGLDQDSAKRVYGKLALNSFTLAAAYSERVKAIPTASFGTVFDDPRSQSKDTQSALDLGYSGQLSARTNLVARAYYGTYSYDGVFPNDPAPIVVNQDQGRSAWWGADAQLMGQYGQHKLVTGAEYQDNFRQDQSNYDIAPYALYLDDKRSSRREALYVQDEMTLRENLLFNAGLRYDHYSTAGNVFNPRLALIYNPRTETAIKFLYGTAFRAPNAYELYYGNGIDSKADTTLKPEKITTYELVAEHEFQPNFHLSASAYYNRISDLINQLLDPADNLLVYRNIGQTDARGVEFEAERAWEDDTRLRVSYAWQLSRDQGSNAELVNSPRHLAKLNYSVPMLDNSLRVGAELQYTGSRKTLADGSAGGYVIANLTLTSQKLAHGLELSASIYNLFDRRYADPGRPEHVQDVIGQDGRNFRLQLSERF
jgi:iron complex outermembrane receptor protein